jgi:hypothetical protein
MYYRIWFDERDESDWVLNNAWKRDERAIDVWSYVRCVRGQRDPQPLLKIQRPGERTTFELAGPEQVPVAAPEVADVLLQIVGSDIERIPAEVEDGTRMDIVNALACVDAIDYSRSLVECFGPHDKVRPDLAGEVSVVERLVLATENIGDHHIFRLRDWLLPVIVSEAVKVALERLNVTGIVFDPISTTGAQNGRIVYWDNDLRTKVIWPQNARREFMTARNVCRL